MDLDKWVYQGDHLVFRKMVIMCKRLDLIGGKVIARDGTKLRAQTSKKNNYNQNKS